MRSFPIPCVTWMPPKYGEARVLSSSAIPKVRTHSVIHQYLLGLEPDKVCTKLDITREEFCVAVLYELSERGLQLRDYEDLRRDIIDWAYFCYSQMYSREAISWPPHRSRNTKTGSQTNINLKKEKK